MSLGQSNCTLLHTEKGKVLLQPLHCLVSLPHCYLLGAWHLLDPSESYLNSLGEEKKCLAN